MKSFAILILLSLNQIYAQYSLPPAIMDSIRDIDRSLSSDRNYIAALTRLNRIHAMPQYAGQPILFNHLGLYNSLVSDYSTAVAFFDSIELLRQSQRHTTSLPPTGLTFDTSQIRPFPAMETILRLAKNNSVVMINERHHMPMHRAFILELLIRLKALGYTHYAAEGLQNHDTITSPTTYPAIGKTGYYVNESVFGELIRTAILLGYKIVAYETTSSASPESDPIKNQNKREKEQAENLYNKTLLQDPHCKVLVHVGYGHNDKMGVGGWIPMASYFKTISGVEPLSIDQIEMFEHRVPYFENPYYRFISGMISQPSVFIENSSNTFWSYLQRGSYDLEICHPKETYVHGRPTWRNIANRYRMYDLPISKKTIAKGLLQAFYHDEPSDAVPADQIVFNTGVQQMIPCLFLQPGKYRFKLVSEDSTISTEWVDIIK